MKKNPNRKKDACFELENVHRPGLNRSEVLQYFPLTQRVNRAASLSDGQSLTHRTTSRLEKKTIFHFFSRAKNTISVLRAAFVILVFISL